MAFSAAELGQFGNAQQPQAQQPQEEEIPYLDLMVNTARENNLPVDAFVAQMWQESRFNPQAVGPETRYGTAKGIAQFIDATAERYGVTDPFNPYQAVPAAGKYMRDLNEQFGNYDWALAGYNAGEGNVTKYGGVPPFPETQDYVAKINQRRKHYAHLVTPQVAAAVQSAQPAQAPQAAPTGIPEPTVGRFDIQPPPPAARPDASRPPAILPGSVTGGRDLGAAYGQFVRDNIGGWFPSEQVRGGDYIDLFQSGTIGIASGLASLGAWGANNVFGQGAGDPFQRVANALDSWAGRNVEAISPEAKYKLAKEFLSADDSAFLDLESVGLKLAQTAPSVIPSIAIGYGMALKGLKMWQIAAGAGATEAGIAGGFAANEISQMIQAMDMAELEATFPEEMAMARKAGITDAQQIKDLAITAAQNEAVLPTMVTTGMLGAVAGAGIGRLAGRTGEQAAKAQGLTRTPKRGIRRRAAEGFLTEAATEAPQSGLEQYWQNKALNRPAMEGVAEQFVAGGVLGGLLGGPPAVVFGDRGDRPIPTDTKDDVANDTQGLTDSSIAAAVEAAQQLELPLEGGTQVMTTPTPPPPPAQVGLPGPAQPGATAQLGLPLETPPAGPTPPGIGGGGPLQPAAPTDVTYPSGGGVSAARLAGAQAGIPQGPTGGPAAQRAPGYGDITDYEAQQAAAQQASYERALQAEDARGAAEDRARFAEVEQVREQEEAAQRLEAEDEQQAINRALIRFGRRREAALKGETPEVQQLGLDFGEEAARTERLPAPEPRGVPTAPPDIPATDQFRGIGQEGVAGSPRGEGAIPGAIPPPPEEATPRISQEDRQRLDDLRLALALRLEEKGDEIGMDAAMNASMGDPEFLRVIEQEAAENPELINFFPEEVRDSVNAEFRQAAYEANRETIRGKQFQHEALRDEALRNLDLKVRDDLIALSGERARLMAVDTAVELERATAQVGAATAERAAWEQEYQPTAQLQNEQLDMFQEELDEVLAAMRASYERAQIRGEKADKAIAAAHQRLSDARIAQQRPQNERDDIQRALAMRKKRRQEMDQAEEGKLTPGQEFYLGLLLNAAEQAGMNEAQIEEALAEEGVYDRMPQLDDELQDTAGTPRGAGMREIPTGLSRSQRAAFKASLGTGFAQDVSRAEAGRTAAQPTPEERQERNIAAATAGAKTQTEEQRERIKEQRTGAPRDRLLKEDVARIVRRMALPKRQGGLGLIDQMGEYSAQVKMIQEMLRIAFIRHARSLTKKGQAAKADLETWQPNNTFVENMNEAFAENNLLGWDRREVLDVLYEMGDGDFYDFTVVPTRQPTAEPTPQRPEMVSRTEVAGLPEDLTPEEKAREATKTLRAYSGEELQAEQIEPVAEEDIEKIEPELDRQGRLKSQRRRKKAKETYGPKATKAEAAKKKSKERAAKKKAAAPKKPTKKPAKKPVKKAAPKEEPVPEIVPPPEQQREELAGLRDKVARVRKDDSIKAWAEDVKATFARFGLNTAPITKLINKHSGAKLKAEVKSRISSAMQSLRKAEPKAKPAKKPKAKEESDVEQEVSYEQEEAEAAPTGSGSASVSDRPEYYRPADDTGSGGGRRSYQTITGPSRKPTYKIASGAYPAGTENSQLYGAEVILSKLLKDTTADENAVVMLGDDTGFGKTRQLLIAASEFQKKYTGENKKVLFVVKSDGNAQTIKEQAAEMGMDEPVTVSYQSISNIGTNKQPKAETMAILDDKYGLIIFDEAHEMRNPEGVRTEAINEFRRRTGAKKIVHATATPADHEAGMYLVYDMLSTNGMLPFSIRTYPEFLADIGIEYRDTGKTHNIKMMRYKEGANAATVVKKLMAYQERLRKANAVLARRFPPLATPEVVVVSDRELVNPIPGKYAGSALSLLNGIVNSNQDSLKIINQSAVAEEAAKAKKTNKLIDKALKEGDNVIVFAGRHRDKATVNTYTGGPYEVPSVLDGVIKHLESKGLVKGTDFAVVVDQARTKKVREKFQNPDDPMRILLTTTQKTGASIDLDSRPGMPRRTVIMTQVPWSAIEIGQAIGRVDRRTTDPDNPPRILVLSSNRFGDARRIGIIQRKIANMQAVRAGQGEQIGTGLEDQIEKQAADMGNAKYFATEGRDGGINLKLNDLAFSQGATTFDDAIEIIKKAGGKPVPGMRLFWHIPAKNRESVIDKLDRLAESSRTTESMPKTRKTQDAATGFDNEVNKFLMSNVLAGNEIRLNDLLDLIGQRKGWLGRLARIAKSYGIDIPVYAGDLDRFEQAESLGEYQFDTVDGRPTNRRIVLRLDDTQIVQTIMHETWHAITAHALVTSNEFAMTLDRLRRDIANAFTQEQRDLYEDALSNVDEFVSESITNRGFQQLLQETDLEQASAWKTMWRKVANAFRRIFNLPIQSGVYAQVMEQMQGVTLYEDEIALTSPADRISRTVNEASGVESMQLVATVNEQLARASMHTAGVGTTMRRLLKLPMLTGRQIVDAYDQYFDGALKALNNLVKLKAREVNRLMTQSFNLSHRWSALKKQDAEQERLMSKIMGEATMFGVHPEVDFNHERNKHLRENAAGDALPQKKIDINRKNHKDVRDQYLQLDNEFQQHYAAVESYYAEDWNDTVRYIKMNILRQYDVHKKVEPGTKNVEAVLSGIADNMVNKAAVKELLDRLQTIDPENMTSDVTDRLGEELNFVLGRGKMQGPYFPLRRHGDYVVRMYGPVQEPTFATKKEAIAHRQAKAWEDPSLKFTTVKELDNGQFGYTYQEQLVEFYELKGEADQRVEELKAMEQDGYKVLDIDRKKTYTANERISNVLFERVIDRLSDDPRLQNAFKAAAIEMMPETSIKKAQLRRSNVRGYSNDMQRAFAQHATSSSHYLSQLRYGHELSEAMRNAEQKIGGSNTLIMRDVHNELKKRDELDASPPVDNPILDSMASYSFFHFLGSPSYWFINATQPHMITTPWLGARYGFNASRKAMSKAYSALSSPVMNNMRDAMKKMGTFDEIPPELFDFLMEGMDGQTTIFTAMQDSIRQGNFLPDADANQVRTNEIISMLDRLGELNIISMTFAADTRSIAAGRADSKLGRIMDYSRIMPHLVEVMNRTVTATAAYNLARDNGMELEAAQEFAEQAVAETQFDYSTENKPRYFNQKQFALARPILMFQQHTQHMYVLLLRSIVQAAWTPLSKKWKGEALTEEDKEQIRLARRTFMGITGTHMAMAGVVGGLFEPIKWAIGLGAMLLGGDDDEPRNLTAAWRRNTKGVFEGLGFDRDTAATLERLMNQGAIPGMLGVDLQTRIGLNRMIYWDDDQGKEGREWYRNMVVGALGPMSSIFEGIAATPEYVRKGDYYGALQASTPKLFRDMFKGAGLATRGMLDYNGNTIRPAHDLSPADVLITSLGLSPSRISETYAERRAVNSAKRFFDTRRSHLIEQYYRANAAGKRRLMAGPIARFNRRVPDAKLRITSETLQRSSDQRLLQEQQMRRDAAYTTPAQRGIKERYGGVGDI